MAEERIEEQAGGKRSLVTVVSLLLILILVAAVWHGQGKRAGEQTEPEPIRKQVAQVALSMMQADLSALVHQETRPVFLTGQPGDIQGKAADRISFFAWAFQRSDSGEIEKRAALVEYRLRPDPKVPGHYLMRREVIVTKPEGPKHESDLSLAGMVESLQIRYTDENGKTVDRWNAKDGDSGNLKMVEIQLSLLLATGGAEKYVAVLKPRSIP